jgi:hypothetical protein
MCLEDMRMFRFTSGKQDGQRDKLRERHKDIKRERQKDRKTEDSLKLDGDVRVLFQSDNPDVPRGYEDVPFYFW